MYLNYFQVLIKQLVQISKYHNYQCYLNYFLYKLFHNLFSHNYILANYFGYCVYPKSVIRACGYLQRI